MKVIFKPKSPDYKKVEEFNLDDNNPRVSIGRKPDNDFSIGAKNVSSYHAVLQYENGRFFLEDLNSTNGLFVNNRKITGKSEIVHGDKISFATVEFLVEFDIPKAETVEEKEMSAEPNGTVIINQTEIPSLENTGGNIPEPEINIEGNGETLPPIDNITEQPGRSTVLFGMKNVLSSGRLVRIDDQFNPLNEYNLDNPETTIGRENCDLIFDHSSISRFHCLIKKQAGNNYQINDNNSTNGVFINGKKITKHTLVHEDIVKIGDLEFVYLEPGKIFYKENLKNGEKTSSPLGNKKLIYIAGGVLVVLLIVLMLIPGSSSSGTKRKKAQILSEKEIVTQIQNSLENNSWDEVVDLINSFNVQGQEKALEKAKKEIKAREVYNKLSDALNNHQWDEAKRILGTIDSSTTYYEKGNNKIQSSIENYKGEKEENIENLMEEGNYTNAYNNAVALQNEFPEDAKIIDFVDNIKTKTSKLKRQAASRQAYRRKINKAKSQAENYLREAKSNYLNGKIVDALTSLNNAKLSYEKAGLKSPNRINDKYNKMKQLRIKYNSGKRLMMQGNAESASKDFEEVFSYSKSLYATNGTIEKEIMSLMSDFYLKKGKQYFNSGNYVKAYKFIDKVLSVNPANIEAKSLKRDISGKAQKLYTNGYIEQTQYKDCKRALFYYRQVIELIPSTDPLYAKTLKRIKDCDK